MRNVDLKEQIAPFLLLLYLALIVVMLTGAFLIWRGP